jgi:outer membrane protein
MSVGIRTALAALVLTIGTATATTAGAQTAATAVKFAFINSQQILAVAPGRAEAEAQFQKEVESVRAQNKAMQDSLQAMIADYQNTSSTMSAADRTARETTIRGKEASFQQRQQQLEQAAQARQGELIQPIFDRINKVLGDVRLENGYTAILDVAPNAGGAVVSYDKNLDITDRVIARVKALPATTGSPSSAGTGVGGSTSTPKGAPQPAPAGVSRPRSPGSN